MEGRGDQETIELDITHVYMNISRSLNHIEHWATNDFQNKASRTTRPTANNCYRGEPRIYTCICTRRYINKIQVRERHRDVDICGESQHRRNYLGVEPWIIEVMLSHEQKYAIQGQQAHHTSYVVRIRQKVRQ